MYNTQVRRTLKDPERPSFIVTECGTVLPICKNFKALLINWQNLLDFTNNLNRVYYYVYQYVFYFY